MNRENIFWPLGARPLSAVLGALLAVPLLAATCSAKTTLSSSLSVLRTPELLVGETYSLAKHQGAPLRVTYKGDMDVLLWIVPVRVRPKELKPGFEPIPDLSWIDVERSSFAVRQPGQRVATDIRITIPLGAEHFGKRYQANVRISIVPLGGGPPRPVSIALESRFLIFVAAEEAKPKIERSPHPGKGEKNGAENQLHQKR